MQNTGAFLLTLGALLSMIAALAHLACIIWGAPLYRFMGAGGKLASAVEAGQLYPTIITLGISFILTGWALYALSGAGVIPGLPFTKLTLAGISAVYLGRAIAFPLLKPAFPENSQLFWLVSSAICLVIGLVHAVGLVLRWQMI